MKKYLFFLLIVLTAFTACRQKDNIKPQRRDIVDAVFGSGHLEHINQYTITTNAEGFINAAYVSEGDTVKANEILFRLSGDVQQTQVANAAVNLNHAKGNAQQGSPQVEQFKLQIAQAQKNYR